MLSSELNADTPDPASIALRGQMKAEFLNALSNIDQTLEDWPNAELVVYGSTLMRQLSHHEGVKFPLEGMKSSDIDIGVFEKERSYKNDFEPNLLASVPPIIRQAIVDSGFSYIRIKDHIGKHTEESRIDDVQSMPGHSFLGDFFLVNTFTPEEMHERLQNRNDYNNLKTCIPNEPLDVRLVIGTNDKPFPLLMDPIDTAPESGQGTFKRTRALDMLAGKIVRSMTDKYKPTDFIDIYNLVNSTCEADGKPYINIDPESPDNHIDALRVMIISYMPMSRGIYVDRPTLLSTFQDTPKRKETFIERVRDQIATDRLPELEDHIDDIFSAVNDTMSTVMGQRSTPSHGPLNLTDTENQFIDEINGHYAISKKETSPEKSGIKFLGITFRKQVDATYNIKLGEARINTGLLTESYPEVFEAYPDLEHNIKNNSILHAKMLEHRFGRQNNDVAFDM